MEVTRQMGVSEFLSSVKGVLETNIQAHIHTYEQFRVNN